MLYYTAPTLLLHKNFKTDYYRTRGAIAGVVCMRCYVGTLVSEGIFTITAKVAVSLPDASPSLLLENESSNVKWVY